MKWLILILLGMVSIVAYAQYPTGISAHNGPIFTNAILGFVDVHSLLAYNSSFSQCPYGASVQLNVILQVNTTTTTYYYWLQDVADFSTNSSVMNFVDNVWNSTAYLANITQIKGQGSVYNSTYYINGKPINVSFYAASTYIMPYKLPYIFYLLINESYNSSGVIVNFGYLIIRNGSEIYPPNLVFYDTVFIPVKGIVSASIIVNDSYTGWDLKDAELVWGGVFGGEKTSFLNMSSFLALYYSQNDHWKSFNLVYTYGNDTAEAADNLHVNITFDLAYVTTGTPNPTSYTVKFLPPFLTYFNITSPVPFYINGSLVNITSLAGYCDEPLSIGFIKNYTANSSAFAILNGQQNITIYPSDFMPNAYYIKPNYTWYYLVKVNSPVPVKAIINGKEEELQSGFYPNGTVIEIFNQTYYYSSTHRLIVKPTIVVINSPINITVSGISQYYVNVSSPVTVYAIVNGKNETLISGWYNANTTIEVFNQTYYYSPTHRFIVKPITVVIRSPINITVTGISQYYVISPIPLHAIINGENETLISGWYNANTTIQIVNQTYYYSSTHRLIVKPTTIVVNSPINITVSGISQYYINVTSPIPLYAVINGKNETLISGWYNANTSVNIENITYYPSSSERYVITSITPSPIFTVNSPLSVGVKAVKQYLVTVQSSYPITINGITTNQEWVNAGTTITLNANLPFYLIGSFKGTENISIGGSVVVNQPINETLVTSISPILIGVIAVIIIIAVALVVILMRRR
ncbi:thermopsin family protease [Sulfolobus tengchongensis]|uniref:Thermopsin family protease n=1 Tax=Sulfolobus tengchongensis TaxID=207809 RepID=A0AAX4L2F9_9CREN